MWIDDKNSKKGCFHDFINDLKINKNTYGCFFCDSSCTTVIFVFVCSSLCDPPPRSFDFILCLLPSFRDARTTDCFWPFLQSSKIFNPGPRISKFSVSEMVHESLPLFIELVDDPFDLNIFVLHVEYNETCIFVILPVLFNVIQMPFLSVIM